MHTPNEVAVRKLATLRQDQFKPVRDYLETELELTKERLTIAEGANVLARLQGRAQLITEFLEMIEKSPDLIV